MTPEIRLSYFEHLIDLVAGGKYLTLLSILHSIEFEVIVDNDINRVTDVEDYREHFAENNNIIGGFPEDPVSVFEVIAILAVRMNDLLIGIEQNDQTSEWFWEMLENLKLTEFIDFEKITDEDINVIRTRIDIFMSRRYSKKGLGGLFPVTLSKQDQRNTEIWYQMSAYIEEKYPHI